MELRLRERKEMEEEEIIWMEDNLEDSEDRKGKRDHGTVYIKNREYYCIFTQQ